jgi:hypothetical protein
MPTPQPDRPGHPDRRDPSLRPRGSLGLVSVTNAVRLLHRFRCAYWRITLRVIVIALIAFAIYGAVLAIHGIHHPAR